MRKIQAGLIGAGVTGPLHVEAVRRLGHADVIAVAASTLESARKKAEALNIERAYPTYQELIADPMIEVVHVCAPNYLHYPVAMAAISAGKHIICDNPLALNLVEARQMCDRARASRVVNAVVFDYRFHAMLKQARAVVARGDLGTVRFVHGHYLKDWMLYETDFSWRLEADKGGASSSVGGMGSHWLDAVGFITGLRVERVLASLSTMVQVRRKSAIALDSFSAAAFADQSEDYVVTSDDLGSVLLEFEGGARGVFSVGEICPGHKNDMRIEINGARASLQWHQERPDQLWLGYRDQPNSWLARDSNLLDESVQRYANVPGGCGEGWKDALKNLVANVYSFISSGLDPERDADRIDFPTFQDGYRANCIVDAIVRSNVDRSRWTKVEYGRNDE